MTVAFLGTLAALGFVGAFASGLVGVGGAVILIPLLYYVPPLLGVGSLDIKLVAGVTMGQVLVAALVGAWLHGRAMMVDRSLATIGGTAMALGSLAGAVASRYVDGRVLLVVFGLMGLAALPLMFVSVAPSDVAEKPPGSFDRRAAVAYPGLIGLMAGLVGAGGAFLLIPVLTGLLRVPLRLAIGTSLTITMVSALTGFVGKLLTRQVPLWATLAVMVGSVSGAPIGVRLSRTAPVDVLRGVLVTLIALATARVWADVLFP